jgi:hypothetical protein
VISSFRQHTDGILASWIDRFLFAQKTSQHDESVGIPSAVVLEPRHKNTAPLWRSYRLQFKIESPSSMVTSHNRPMALFNLKSATRSI